MSSRKWMLAAVAGGLFGVAQSLGQSVSQQPDEKQSGARPDTTSEQQPGSGKVLFSRSSSDATKTRSGGNAPVAPAQEGKSAGPAATDQEREALAILQYDLDVRLIPQQESIAVRAQVTVRNDSEQPLKQIALQLSSLLKWEQIRSDNGVPFQFSQHTIDSDADHTGAVNEAVVSLPQPLAPKAELKLDVLYSGQIPQSAKRLERIGAPADVAERSDWDRISPEFTGLRGFGNVIWYPVSARPALLGDGAKLFHEIGRQKLKESQARVRMKVTEEFFGDTPSGAPNLAVLDGHVVPVVEPAAPEASFPGIVTTSLHETALGFAVPSLFLTTRKEVDGGGVEVFARSDDEVNAQAFSTAATLVTPLMQQWLGQKPESLPVVVDLPEGNDAAAEVDSVYFAGMNSVNPQMHTAGMVPPMARAYFSSPRQWLSEGVAQFMATLWTEETQGRRAALEQMESTRGALAIAEPGTPGDASGQDLIHASEDIYYRTKSAYVIWMLRDLAGDAALGIALRTYRPEEDATPDYFEHLLEKTSGKDLRWFFDSWVYNDRGLPDLSVAGVFPSKSTVQGQYLVALDVANDGYADAEVPVTVRSSETTVTERLRVPARSKISHRMLIQGLPTEVQVNDGTVPEVEASVHMQTLNPVGNGK